jgi:c-di-GMP-binding flagellar brake protein YcgR
MPEPVRAQTVADEKKESKPGTPAVRLRRFIDVVIEDKLSFALFRAVAVDFSSTGMRIITDQYLAKNTKYTFTMKQQPALTLRGEVRWIRPAERDTFQCGVLFVDVSAEDRRRLESFIDFERQRTATQ